MSMSADGRFRLADAHWTGFSPYNSGANDRWVAGEQRFVRGDQGRDDQGRDDQGRSGPHR